MVIELPWPPSVNHYWNRFKHGVYISKKGIEYREHVQYSVKNHAGIYKDSDRLSMIIHAFPPDKRRRDLDNILKSLLDSLQHAQIYPDDNNIDDLHIIRRKENNNKVIVFIDKLPNYQGTSLSSKFS